jgi:sortase A
MWGRGHDTSTLAYQPPPRSSDIATVPPQAEPGGAPAATPAAGDQPVDGIAFDMTVPAIGYSATVREGVDLATLEYGPGHYPTTTWPGHSGIVGVAAHNVYWLRFAQLKPGDLIELRTTRGTFDYRLTGSEVTDPNDRGILVSSPEHRLVMTTCYPLWAGAFATQRLIFFASEIGPIAHPA